MKKTGDIEIHFLTWQNFEHGNDGKDPVHWERV